MILDMSFSKSLYSSASTVVGSAIGVLVGVAIVGALGLKFYEQGMTELKKRWDAPAAQTQTADGDLPNGDRIVTYQGQKYLVKKKDVPRISKDEEEGDEIPPGFYPPGSNYPKPLR